MNQHSRRTVLGRREGRRAAVADRRTHFGGGLLGGIVGLHYEWYLGWLRVERNGPSHGCSHGNSGVVRAAVDLTIRRM